MKFICGSIFLFQRDIARPINRCLSVSSASGSSPSPFLFIKMFSPSNIGIISSEFRTGQYRDVGHRNNAPHFTLQNLSESLSDLYGCATVFWRFLTFIRRNFSILDRFWKKPNFDKFLGFRHILVSLHEFSEVNFFSFVSGLIFFHSMNRYCYQIIRQ